MAYRLTEIRRSGVIPYLRPDGAQITIEYKGGVPVRLEML